ncbi:hypothetical protein [Phenylobacterium sp.]|uniref:hypothetical protein n=1 Tax=Phenylobacterium sp. TaxID=1871053 RepID=UPI0039533C58
MAKRVPISAAKALADAQGLRQVVVLGFDGERIHVVSYGVTKADCAHAAKSATWAMSALTSPTAIADLPDEDRLGADA